MSVMERLLMCGYTADMHVIYAINTKMTPLDCVPLREL